MTQSLKHSRIGSIAIVIILTLSILPIFSPGVEAAYGDIGNAVVDSWEYDIEESVMVARGAGLLRINSTNYYISVAMGDTGTDADGFIRTILAWNSNGTIYKTLIDKYSYDTDGTFATVIQIPGTGKYVISYRDATDSKIITIPISSTGDIGAIIDTQSVTNRMSDSMAFFLGNNVYTLIYDSDADDDGFIETWWIDSTGVINNTRLDQQEFDTTYGRYPFGCIVDSNTIAVTFADTSTTGEFMLNTYNITSSGIITNTPADTWSYEVDPFYVSRISVIGTNTFALTYIDSGYDVNCKTVTITDTGAITKSWIDTLEVVDGTTIDYLYIFKVRDPVTYTTTGILGCTLKGISSTGPEKDGYLYTWSCDNLGNLGAAIIDSLEFDTTSSEDFACVAYMGNNYYLIGYSFSDRDGFVCTVTISTEVPATVYPTINNHWPATAAHVTCSWNKTLGLNVTDCFPGNVTIWLVDDAGNTSTTTATGSDPDTITRDVSAKSFTVGSTYTWGVRCHYDTEGTWTNASYTFTIDNTASTLSAQAPLNQTYALSYWQANSAYTVTVADCDYTAFGDTLNVYIRFQDAGGWHTNSWLGVAPGTRTVTHATAGTNFVQDTKYYWTVNSSQNGVWLNRTYWVTMLGAVITLPPTNVGYYNATLNANSTYGIRGGFWLGDEWPVNATNFDRNITMTDNYYPANSYGYNGSWADWNGDHVVNHEDLYYLYNDQVEDYPGEPLGYYRETGGPWELPNPRYYVDFNRDGRVSYIDVSYFVGHYTLYENMSDGFSIAVGSLQPTTHYSYLAWVNGSFFTGDPMDLFTVPNPPTNFGVTSQVINNVTFSWTDVDTNDPDNITYILVYSNSSCPANISDGIVMGETNDTEFEYEFAPNQDYQVTIFTNFSGMLSGPAECIGLVAEGGVYTFWLLHESPLWSYAPIDLDLSHIGKHTFKVYYTDKSEQTNYYRYEINVSKSFNNLTELILDWLPSMEALLSKMSFGGQNCPYIYKISWIINHRDEVEIKVQYKGLIKNQIYVVGLMNDKGRTLLSTLGGFEASGSSQTHTFISYGKPWDIGDVNKGFTAGIYSWSFDDMPGSVPGNLEKYFNLGKLKLDTEKVSKERFATKSFEKGDQDCGECEIDDFISAAKNWITEGVQTTWQTQIATPVTNTVAGCRAWWNTTYDAVKAKVGTKASLPDGFQRDLEFLRDMLDVNFSGGFGSWTMHESNLTDVNKHDGTFDVTTTKDIDYVTFEWGESTINTSLNFFDIPGFETYTLSFNNSFYCKRTLVLEKAQSEADIYLRTDMKYYPLIDSTNPFDILGLVQYHMVFSDLSVVEGGTPYGEISFVLDGVKQIVHSEYIDSQHQIHPMLIFGKHYQIRVVYVDEDKNVLKVVNIGDFVPGKNTDVSIIGQAVDYGDSFRKYITLTPIWTATGFEIEYFETLRLTELVYFTVYNYSGYEVFNTTDSSFSHTYTYVGATDVPYYYKFIVDLGAIGTFSSALMMIAPVDTTPTISGNYINFIFTLILGPSPLSMGGTSVSWSYIVVLILALIGLFAFVKGKYIGLIVEGFILIGCAVIISDLVASISLAGVGMFLLVIGVLAGLGAKEQAEAEEFAGDVKRQYDKSLKQILGGKKK